MCLTYLNLWISFTRLLDSLVNHVLHGHLVREVPNIKELYLFVTNNWYNFRNTDTVIHIGDEEFHCHQLVLQVYSAFFDMNPRQEIELPIVSSNLTYFLKNA